MIINLKCIKKFQHFIRHITPISEKDIDGLEIKKSPRFISALESLYKRIYCPGELNAIDVGMMPLNGEMKNGVHCPMNPDKWEMIFYIIAESGTGFVYN